MVHLLLSEPNLNEDGDEKAAKDLISLLKKLESVIWSVITSGGRSEARLWLCTTISSINSISSKNQSHLFIDLLRSNPSNRTVVAQLMQLILEKSPQKAGRIISKRSFILERFFEGNTRRILQWFGNFASVGESEHRKGAKALSQFAFVNRDSCWDELEWKGKHGQSPAVVATKPHYFLDLDVLTTVENFLENVPEFWTSDELAESVKDGEIFRVDTKFFIDYFIHLMYKENSEDIWRITSEFLEDQQFSFLCQHLLIMLEECELCQFLDRLTKFLIKSPECTVDFDNPSFWLEILLLKGDNGDFIHDLLLINAFINQGRQLIRLLNDEEHEDEKGIIEKVLAENVAALNDASHQTLMRGCLRENKAVAIKWLGLQSWVIHYNLLKECKKPESWEALFIGNRISFQKSYDYSLVKFDRFSESKGSGSELESECTIRSRRKKKRKTGKNRKTYHHDEDNEFEQVELDASSGRRRLDVGSGSWLLSTDGYSCSWNNTDLPAHLAGYCFSSWMKWVYSKWSSSA